MFDWTCRYSRYKKNQLTTYKSGFSYYFFTNGSKAKSIRILNTNGWRIKATKKKQRILLVQVVWSKSLSFCCCIYIQFLFKYDLLVQDYIKIREFFILICFFFFLKIKVVTNNLHPLYIKKIKCILRSF